jgi:transcriptional regulator with XRE-family HTH domain
MKSLGEIITNYMNENNLSQRDFAKLAHISHTYVSKLQTGIDPRSGKLIEPTLEVVEKIAKALNMPLEVLLKELGKISMETNNHIDQEMTFVNELPNSVLNKKDERDIEKLLNNTMEYIESQEGLMLNGEILDEQDIELLKHAIKNGLEYAKISNKKRFTPKKYRKDKE